MVRILGVGVATLDIYTNLKRMYPGGNEYNVVCNVKKLGAEAGFLGVFGNDVAGAILEGTLKDLGIDISHCHHEIGSSGYSLVELKEDGDRLFLEWNQEGVTDLYPIQFNEEEMEYVKSFDVLTLGRLADVSFENIQRLYQSGMDLSYDFHASFTQEDVKKISPYIRYGFFSCSHLNEKEIKEYLKLCVDCGCSIAIGTRGIDSILAYDGKKFYEQETFKVIPTDTLGAGDSYIGAFLTYYLQSKNIQSSLELAAKHSAKVVLIEGSIGVGYDVDPEHIDEILNVK